MAKTVIWPEKASIERAADLRLELMAAFEEDKAVALDLSAVKNIDVSAIQIVLAAFKEAGNSGVEFHLTGNLRAEAAQKLGLGGFIDQNLQDAGAVERQLLKLLD